MKLNVNHVALAISLSLAFSSGTAFALPFLSDDDIDTVTSVGRQVADGLQAGTGSRGLQSVSAIPIDTSLLNGHNERSSVLTRSTPRAPINPPVWVPMDPEREELGPGEAPRPKKPRHAKKKKSAHPKRVAKKSSKKSAKLSRVERKLLQHQSALRDQKMPGSKNAKAGKPAEGGHHGNSKSSHSNSQPPPLNKSNHKGKAGKGAPPGKGDHKHPGNFRRSLDENEQMFERDEQDEQTEKAGQAPGQGEPKGDEIEQPKGPQPTLAGMLLPIKRSLWSSPSGDLFIYDRDIDDAVEDARDDDDGNVFWDRDIDDIETRDVGLSEEELEDARELLADLVTSEDARDSVAQELFAAHPPTIGKRGELDDAIEDAWARAIVEDDIAARDWRLSAQKAIDCSVDPGGCALKYALSYTGLEPSEGQKATFDRWRAAAQKARDCGTDPAGCVMNHGLKSVGLEPPSGR